MTEIRLTQRETIAEIVLDGPDSRNALDADNLRQIGAAVSELADSGPKLSAVLIRGEGKVFSSGRDISAVDVDTDDARSFLAEVFAPVFQAIRALPVPVIAQVQGAALGLGFGIAAAADIIYAADDAKFGSPFAAIGAMLDSGAHHVFLDRLGYHRTMDLIITGDFLTGAEAAAAGIVSRAVPAADLADFVTAKLDRIVTGPAEAFAMEKRFVQRLADERPHLAQVIAEEATLQETARQTADYAEGFRAFQERRKPNFGSGR